MLAYRNSSNGVPVMFWVHPEIKRLRCILPTTRADSGLSPVSDVRRKAHYKKDKDCF